MSVKMRKTPLSEIVEITPEMAEEWLGHNSHNRALRNREVSRIAGAILRGEWRVNGESIRWSKTGTLIDGQHRLWGVVEAGLPIKTYVTWGLDEDVQETIDGGIKRNLRDALKLRGISNAAQIAAALNYLFRVVNGAVRDTGLRPTVAQGIALLDEHPTIVDASRSATRLLQRFHLSGAMAACALYEFDSIDSDACEVFLDSLIDGVGLKKGMPVYHLRQYLERREASASGSRSSSVMTHALFNKAWNAYRQGRQIDGLSWKAAGIHAEAFPVAE